MCIRDSSEAYMDCDWDLVLSWFDYIQIFVSCCRNLGYLSTRRDFCREWSGSWNPYWMRYRQMWLIFRQFKLYYILCLFFCLQLQFMLVFIHSAQVLFFDCGYPKLVAALLLVHSTIFFVLFFDFYQQAYKKRMKLEAKMRWAAGGRDRSRRMIVSCRTDGD